MKAKPAHDNRLAMVSRLRILRDPELKVRLPRWTCRCGVVGYFGPASITLDEHLAFTCQGARLAC